MKYALIVCLLFPLSVLAQDINKKDSQGRKQGRWVEKWPKSAVKKYDGNFKDNKPVGKFTFWYESGKPRAIIKYQKDGKTAYAQFYHETGGELMGHGKYINKEKDSTWSYYDQRGRQSYIENYKNGKLDGDKKIYYVDANVTNFSATFKEGRLLQSSHYENGLLDGEFIEYYQDGKIKMKGQYSDGNKEGAFTYYYPSGKIEKSEHYKYSVKHGAVVWLDENGKQIGKVFYREGRIIKGKELEIFLEKGGYDK